MCYCTVSALYFIPAAGISYWIYCFILHTSSLHLILDILLYTLYQEHASHIGYIALHIIAAACISHWIYCFILYTSSMHLTLDILLYTL